MNTLSYDILLLLKVVLTCLTAGGALIGIAKLLYRELDAHFWLKLLLEGCTIPFVVAAICVGVKHLFT